MSRITKFSLLGLLSEKKKFVSRNNNYYASNKKKAIYLFAYLRQPHLRKRTTESTYLVLLIFARRGRRDLRKEIC